MAMSTNLPPQAYTRDTLVKAIEWLSRQPPAVRERATHADLIVSHFLAACRKAEAQSEAPISGEVFREDLKHLAEDLKQFEEPFAPPFVNRSKAEIPPTRREPRAGEPPSLYIAAEPSPAPAHESFFRPVETPRSEPGYASRGETGYAPRAESGYIPRGAAPSQNPEMPRPAPPPAAAPQGINFQVDSRSLVVARDLCQRLNLSNESEALRMLITLGAEHARTLFR